MTRKTIIFLSLKSQKALVHDILSKYCTSIHMLFVCIHVIRLSIIQCFSDWCRSFIQCDVFIQSGNSVFLVLNDISLVRPKYQKKHEVWLWLYFLNMTHLMTFLSFRANCRLQTVLGQICACFNNKCEIEDENLFIFTFSVCERCCLWVWLERKRMQSFTWEMGRE